MSKKIFITGGAGYVGSHTVQYLSSLGYETLVYDSLVNGYKEAVIGANLVKGDLSNFPFLDATIREFGPDAVIHFAATADVPDSLINPNNYYTNNISYGLNLLNAMKNNHINYIVFSSSAAVYGSPNLELISEDTPLNPISPYGRSKLYFEQILKDFGTAYGIKSVSLRYFCAAGASFDASIGESHLPENHLIPLILKNILGISSLFRVYGNDFPTKDGTGVRDYIHVMDMADAHVKSLEYLLNGGETDSFNVGTGRGYSVMEMIQTAERITGQRVNYTIAGRRGGDPAFLVADPSKIKNVMNWEAKYTLDDMVSTAWNWFKENPYGYDAEKKKVSHDLLIQFKRDIVAQLDSLDINKIAILANKVKETSNNGGSIFLAGNGGSSSVASHMACDLQKTVIKSDVSHTKRKIRAICLTDNIPLMTAWANDVSYDEAFSQQFITLASPNDMIITFSVSGNSESIVKLLEASKKIGAYSFGFLGRDGGKCKDLINDWILFKGSEFSVAESMFSVSSHIISDILKETLSNGNK